VSAEFPATDNRVGFLLRLAHQRATANLAHAIAASGLTPMQFATILRLSEIGPLSQNELGRSIGMPPANIHATVRRLLAGGLIETAPSPVDQRLTLVNLTRSGRETLRRVLPAATAANAVTLSSLTPHEQDLLIGLLRKVAS
jgi:DNA-binding MarR family transcriptional regulator